MWNNKKISVVLPTYNEKDSIRAFIESLQRVAVADEIIVVNNNAAPGTSQEVHKTTATEVHEAVQGYGAAIQRGFDEATGDLIVLFEPDGTFIAHDLMKLLAYSDDFDVVFGTRTSNVLVWEGANMGFFLRWGNYAVAKLMEFLFNTTCLTDVGCTARCVTRGALDEMRPYFTTQGNTFGPEMMLLAIMQSKKIIQIPVNYKERIGLSSVTGSKGVAFFLGLRMIQMILVFRFLAWFGKHPIQRERR